MKPTFKIELIKKTKLLPLAPLCAAVASRAYEPGAAWQLSAFEHDMVAANRIYAVAFLNDKVVGYVAAVRVLDQADISSVAVDPVFQRLGLGQQLMRAMIEKFPAGTSVFLEVRQSNLPANTLYGRVGFRAIGVRKAYYQHPEEDAILMKLTI